jgi:hypothetical protein
MCQKAIASEFFAYFGETRILKEVLGQCYTLRPSFEREFDSKFDSEIYQKEAPARLMYCIGDIDGTQHSFCLRTFAYTEFQPRTYSMSSPPYR